MKLVSWNVNGIRAGVKKGFVEKVVAMDADVVCIQETKAQDDQVTEALEALNGYHVFSNSADKKGYSGTAILTRKEPLTIIKDMNHDVHDGEGRLLFAEYENYYVGSTYVPNSKAGLIRLEERVDWDTELLKFMKDLERKKPVLLGGDFNVCHKEIDIARPAANYDKSPGYTQKEIDGMDNFTNSGFVDTFRALHPDEVKYSWWSLRGGARAKNVGWRLDYFLASKGLMGKIKQADIWTQIEGSDHCPVILEIED